MPASAPTLSGPANRPPALVWLGIALLVPGVLLALGFVGVPPLLTTLARRWQVLLGLAALPAVAGLLWAGTMLVLRRQQDTWVLPWGRALAVQTAVLSALVLLALGSGQPAGGPGGLVGWALARSSTEAVGQVGTLLAWLGLGVVALLATFRVGAQQIAARLNAWADTLAVAPAHAAVVPPPAVAPVRPAAAPTAPRATATAVAVAAAAGVAAETAPPAPVTVAAATPNTIKMTGFQPATPAKSSRPPARANHLPNVDLLEDDAGEAWDERDARTMAVRIEKALAGFGVPVEVVAIERGPSVTRFGLQPGMVSRGGTPQRVKVAQVKALKDDLALALAVPSLRIEAPIAGRPLVGIEVPNPESGSVRLKGIVTSVAFQRRARETSLLLAVGRDVTGEPVLGDLGRMPHLLIAGTTGSGKSVCLHAVLASLLFQNSPAALQLVIVDPKRVELARYKGLPHLVAPVVTEVAECIGALKWAVAEMDRRYRLFEVAGVRDRASHNARQKSGAAPLPALVLVVDELADLMLTSPEDTEPLLARIAQLGRAAGVHLVVATQRPSTDVVTGLLKANFPARIAFSVASGIDSRVILDQSGAEALLGRGDLLFQPPDAPQPVRAQGVFVSDDEVGRLVGFWASGHWRSPTGPAPWADMVPTLDPDEALFEEAMRLTERHARVSASFLQRKLHLGYGRAREVFERLQDEGVVDEDGHTGAGDDGDDDGPDWVDQEFGGG